MTIVGILAAKSSTKSKPAPSRCGSRNSRAQLADACVERGDAPRGERPAHEPAQLVVARRVHEDHHPEARVGVGGVGGRAACVSIISSTVPRAEL